jgi:hypothetical protein
MNIRMTKLAIIIAIVIATAAILLSASTTISMPQPAQAAASAAAKTGGGGAGTITSSIGQQTFKTTLSGNGEVPPINTQATGSATFTVTTNKNSMSYQIHVINIDKVTMAHIHSGKIGQNGPVVVTLFQSKAATTTSSPVKNGILSQGTITSANLEGPLKGKQISDLVKLINDGNAYANVHTKQNPKGEIRGQISSVAAASASTSRGGSSSASAAASASAY